MLIAQTSFACFSIIKKRECVRNMTHSLLESYM